MDFSFDNTHKMKEDFCQIDNVFGMDHLINQEEIFDDWNVSSEESLFQTTSVFDCQTQQSFA